MTEPRIDHGLFYDPLTAHDAYFRDLMTVAWWPKRARGLTREHILKAPRPAIVMAQKEIGLEPPLPVSYCGRQAPAMGVRTEMRDPAMHRERALACEICLEQWTIEQNRKITKRIFAAWGPFEPSRRLPFITTPNI